MILPEYFCIPLDPGEYWKEYIKANFHYNPNTGLVYRRDRVKPIGTKDKKGYLVTRLGPTKVKNEKKNFRLHILAWFLYFDIWPTGEIDHLNSCPSDNRIENLEIVSRQENLTRRRKKGKVNENEPF